MAAVNRNQITAGLLAALQSIDGSGTYHNDLTGDGKVENREWNGPPDVVNGVYVAFWLGARSDVRDGQDADLSQYGQRMRFFLTATVTTTDDPDADVARANDVEADIIQALHLNRTLPVSGSGTIYDLAVDTEVVRGADVITGAEGVFVNLGGEMFWGRY